MKKLIGFDETRYKHLVYELEAEIPWIQQVLEAFNKMDLEPLQPEELRRIFDVENLVFEKMMKNQELKINGLEIDKRRFFEVIMKPKNYTEYHNTANKFSLRKNVVAALKSFVLDEFGNITLSEKKKEELKAKCETWIESEKAIKVHEFAEAFLKLIDDTQIVDTIKTGISFDLKNLMEDLFMYRWNELPTIDYRVVKNFDRIAEKASPSKNVTSANLSDSFGSGAKGMLV